MKKSLYRVVLESATFQANQSLPSFKLKLGKQERMVNPFCTPGLEQHYNHELTVERTAEPDIIIDCLVKEKLLGGGKAVFDDKKEEQKVELLDVKKKKVGVLMLSIKKIEKRFPSYELKVQLLSGQLAVEPTNLAKTSYFLVLKMGDTHIKSKNSETGTKEPHWNQTFDMKSVEESELVVELWSEDVKNTTYAGLCLIKLTDSIGKEHPYDILGPGQKKVGQLKLRIYEEGKTEQIVVNDKNIIPVRMLKMYVLEALMKQDLKSKNTFVKVEADGQKTQTTTSIFAEGKNPKWNQTFQLEIKDADGKVKISICEKDDKGVETVVGSAVLSIKDIENKQYELALKNASNAELGKLYMECDADWLEAKQPSHRSVEEEQPEPDRQEVPKIKSTVPAYKSAAGSNEQLERKINEMKAKYSSKPSLHEYFYAELNAVLEEGLLKIAKDKPADPIRELGLFLINYKRK